ncbi:DNA-directed RNA polymerases I and III subunit RPAC2 [Chelonia mydas]|uniref:DNA-directed RNA polymerases I and III subunit RPAC2 n=1 Tax=Chelonia mydas TaxID=8469 RepID=M7ARS3_CHEMY|nr:DNA-directed RNA polymerases I and III subunit RPAC2 [Chelonia mydas]
MREVSPIGITWLHERFDSGTVVLVQLCRCTLVQADGTDGNCVTFVLHDEDHTLGNSLRYMIMKNSEVEFCGYSITHPSESKINFRIQTRGGLLAIEPFRRGLTELVDVCQHVLSKFEEKVSRTFFSNGSSPPTSSGCPLQPQLPLFLAH